MRINRLSIYHQGNQPIRVLQNNITYQFETTNPTFKELSEKIIKTKGLKTGISYYVNDKPIIEKPNGYKGQTPYVDGNSKIAIHETFLSYIWCMSYSLLVLYEEAVAKQSQNQVAKTILHKIDNDRIEKAQELFNYAKSLIVSFSIWDKKSRPNPEEYSYEDAFYIEKANGLFVYAMNFILCHEFAHVERGHIENIKANKNQPSHILDYEKEADERAIELVLLGTDSRTKLSAEIGILIGLCSLLFFKKELKPTNHPATDDRIHNLIRKVNPSPTDAHWGIAALAYKLWDDQFNKDFTWPKEVHDLMELYEHIRNEIKKKKTAAN